MSLLCQACSLDEVRALCDKLVTISNGSLIARDYGGAGNRRTGHRVNRSLLASRSYSAPRCHRERPGNGSIKSKSQEQNSSNTRLLTCAAQQIQCYARQVGYA